MADNPYPLDFFSTITNINFGSGCWLLLDGFGVSATIPQEYDFIDVAGGTPGFTGPVVPNYVVTAPATNNHIITAADLVNKLVTNAGLAIKGGFSFGTFFPISGLTASAILMSLNGFPNSFHIRCNPDAVLPSITLYAPKMVVAGKNIQSLVPAATSPPGLEWLVNQEKLTIVAV